MKKIFWPLVIAFALFAGLATFAHIQPTAASNGGSSIALSADGMYVYVMLNNQVYHSRDYGKTWEPLKVR